MKTFLIALTTITLLQTAAACGCFGPGSCDVDGNINRCNPSASFCDCCPPCNSFNQLYAGCFAKDRHSGFFGPAVPSTFSLNQPIGTYTFFYTGSRADETLSVGDAKIFPDLPAGLSLISDNGTNRLTGVPTETSPPTNYTVILKGPANIIAQGTVLISVGPAQDCSTGSSSTSDSGSSSTGSTVAPGNICSNAGYMSCLSSSTYTTCTNNRYSQPQACRAQTTCQQAGNYVYCI